MSYFSFKTTRERCGGTLLCSICTPHPRAVSQAFSCVSWIAQMWVRHLSFQQEEEGKQSC